MIPSSRALSRKLRTLVLPVLAAVVLTGAGTAGELALGLNYDIYGKHDIESGTGYKATYEHDMVRIFADYSKPKHRILGQGMGDIRLICGGIGAQHDLFSPKLSLYGEFGYCLVNNNAPAIQEAEVVTEWFRQRHTPEPWWPFGEPLDFDHEEYTLDSGAYMMGIGLDYKITRNVALSFGYRFMSLEQHFVAWNGERPGSHPEEDTCNCLLLENNVMNMGHARATLSFRF